MARGIFQTFNFPEVLKRRYNVIAGFLAICLFIYVFYRTEDTVITRFILLLLSDSLFIEVKEAVRGQFPLHEMVIFSLPEGLWVFCITLTSSSFYLRWKRYFFPLMILPIVFSIGLEFLQLSQITNGNFDFWDIGFSLFFWVLALYLTPKARKADLFRPFTTEGLVCILSYLIVYFAHVWK